MCLNFELEFPTRRKSFGVTIIAPLERAGKNLSIYVFCFFLRDSAYDYERVKQSVFYAKKCAARACWSVLARLCRGSSAAAVRLCHLPPIPPAPQRFEELIARCVQFCSSAAGSRELRQPNHLLPIPPLRLESTLCSRVYLCTCVRAYSGVARAAQANASRAISFRFFHFAPTRRTHITKC